MGTPQTSPWVVRLQEVLNERGIGHKRLAAKIQELNDGVTPGGGTAENLRAYRRGAVQNRNRAGVGGVGCLTLDGFLSGATFTVPAPSMASLPVGRR